jgi:hypothetical protein
MNQQIQRKSALRRPLRDTICGLERRFGPGGALHPLVQSVCFQLLQLDEWVRRLERACRKKAAAKGLQGRTPVQWSKPCRPREHSPVPLEKIISEQNQPPCPPAPGGFRQHPTNVVGDRSQLLQRKLVAVAIQLLQIREGPA